MLTFIVAQLDNYFLLFVFDVAFAHNLQVNLLLRLKKKKKKKNDTSVLVPVEINMSQVYAADLPKPEDFFFSLLS